MWHFFLGFPNLVSNVANTTAAVDTITTGIITIFLITAAASTITTATTAFVCKNS